MRTYTPPRWLAPVLILLAVGTAQAQATTGSKLVGLQAGANVVTFAGSTRFYVRCSPSALYLLTDDFAVGGRVTVGVNGGGGTTSFAYGIAPAVRYYLTDGETGRWFARGSVGVASQAARRNDGFVSDAARLSVAAGIGYSIPLNEGLAIEPGFNVGVNRFRNPQFIFSAAVGLQGFFDRLTRRRSTAE